MKIVALVCACLAVSLGISTSGMARTVGGGETIAIQDMTLTVPAGFELLQDAKDNGRIILGFQGVASDEYLTIFVQGASGMDMHDIFVNGSDVVNDIRNFPRNAYNWSLLETRKTHPSNRRTYFITSFLVEHNGFTYYGFSRNESAARANEIVNEFLTALR